MQSYNFVHTNNEIPHITTIPSNAIVTGNNATVDAVIIPPAPDDIVIPIDTLPITLIVFLIFYIFLVRYLTY